MKDNIQDLGKYTNLFDSGKIKGLSNYKNFISRIKIPAPTNYESHHSITNEWCILRWAEMSKDFNNDEINDIKAKLGIINDLYFKYLEESYLLNTEISQRQRYSNKTKEKLSIPYKRGCKIYVIDDEFNKGWDKLFSKAIFKEFSQNQAIDFYNEFNSGQTRKELLKSLKETLPNLIRDQKFNLFLIDLRLCNEDFNGSSELSGFEIVENIKKINPGIQVVIFTASRKAESINKALKCGADSYVIKESPEKISTRKESYSQYIELDRNIKSSIRKLFLAKLYEDVQSIKSNSVTYLTTDKESKFRDYLTNKAGPLFKIFTLLKFNDNTLLSHALLECFAILEKLSDLYFTESHGRNSGSIEIDDSSLKKIYTRTTDNKISTIVQFERGKFSFQNEGSPNTIVGIKFNSSEVLDNMEIVNGLDSSSNYKLLSVLKYRFGIDENLYKQIIELRYLRSNIAAHDTGNVDTSRRSIVPEDILFLIDILNSCFKQ